MLSFSSMNSRPVCCRGAVMVELAIVIPLLVMVVFGITELGRAMYQLNTISKAAASGARYMARVNGLLDRDTCDPLATWAMADAAATNLVIYGNEAGEGDPRLPGMDVEFDSQLVSVTVDDEEVTAGCVISVAVSANFVSIFGSETLIPGTGIGGPITLTQTVQERFIGE